MQIFVDGSARNNQAAEKVSACRIVLVEEGLTFTYPLGNVSNNIAEISAIQMALAYAVRNNAKSVEVLTDSRCALAWVKKGPSKRLPDAKRAEIETIRNVIAGLIEKLEHVELRWIPGEEQLADFGLKHGKKKKE